MDKQDLIYFFMFGNTSALLWENCDQLLVHFAWRVKVEFQTDKSRFYRLFPPSQIQSLKTMQSIYRNEIVSICCSC